MPTSEQIEAAVEQIFALTAEEFRGFTNWKDDRLLCEWYRTKDWDDGIEGTEKRSWQDLGDEGRNHVLRGNVDWSGFTEAQENNVIQRVMEDESPDLWMDGITPDDKPLFKEMREDEAAAKVRDGLSELSAMFEDIANPPNFDRQLEQYAAEAKPREELER